MKSTPTASAAMPGRAAYVRARGAQNYREVYDIIHPRDVVTAPRGLRRTPFYERQKELGAVFTESNGWERPLWFEANADLPVPDGAARSGWNTKHWSPIAGAEHVATRTTAGLFDMSTFTKLHVHGEGALAAMELISCSNVNKPIGGVSYALLLNERGGVETDLTVVRAAGEPLHPDVRQRQRSARSCLDLPANARPAGCADG